MKLLECKQCGGLHWGKRSSKKWCSESCKQKNKRGEPFHDNYHEMSDPDYFKRLDFMTGIYDAQPGVAHALQDIKEQRGHRAMNDAIDLLILFTTTQGD